MRILLTRVVLGIEILGICAFFIAAAWLVYASYTESYPAPNEFEQHKFVDFTFDCAEIYSKPGVVGYRVRLTDHSAYFYPNNRFLLDHSLSENECVQAIHTLNRGGFAKILYTSEQRIIELETERGFYLTYRQSKHIFENQIQPSNRLMGYILLVFMPYACWTSYRVYKRRKQAKSNRPNWLN